MEPNRQYRAILHDIVTRLTLTKTQESMSEEQKT